MPDKWPCVDAEIAIERSGFYGTCGLNNPWHPPADSRPSYVILVGQQDKKARPSQFSYDIPTQSLVERRIESIPRKYSKAHFLELNEL